MTMEDADRARPVDRHDPGFALLVVIGVLSILTILAASAMVLSQQTLADVQRADSTEKAFQAANAGLDAALARVGSVPLANLNGTWPLVAGVGGATYTVNVAPTYPASVTTYTVTAVGVYGSAAQTVTVQIAQTPPSPSPSPYSSFVFPSPYIAPTGNSTTNFWGPLATEGNFTVKGVGGLPANASTHAFVNAIRVHNGQVDTKVEGELAVDLYANYPQTIDPLKNTVGFANYYSSCSTVTLPAFTIADIRAAHADAVVRIPDMASAPDTTATATTLSWWSSSVTTLTTPTGSFAWDNDRSLLTLNGILYVDGSINLPDPLYYTGRGTIVVRGNVTCYRVLPWSTTSNPNTMNQGAPWSPLSSVDNLGIVTGGNITCLNSKISSGGNSIMDYKGYFDMAGTFYAGGTFLVDGTPNRRIKGSLISGSYRTNVGNVHIVFDPDSSYAPPPSMPDGGVVATGLFARVPGTWARE